MLRWMHSCRRVVGFLVLTAVACDRPRTPTAHRPPLDVSDASRAGITADAPSPRARATPSPALSSVRFVLRTTGGALPDQRLPLLVVLHGLGDTPEDFVGLYTALGLRVRIAAAAGIFPWAGGYAWFPIEHTTTERWSEGVRHATDVLVPAIRALAQQHPTCGLPIVSGFSQGAMLSYALAARADGGIAAALPIGGFLPEALFPAARPVTGPLPMVHAFHGTADARIAIALDRSSVAALRAAGYDATLNEYVGVGHTIPEAMWRDLQRRLATILLSFHCPS